MFRVRFYGKNMMWRNTDTDTECKIQDKRSAFFGFDSIQLKKKRTEGDEGQTIVQAHGLLHFLHLFLQSLCHQVRRHYKLEKHRRCYATYYYKKEEEEDMTSDCGWMVAFV